VRTAAPEVLVEAVVRRAAAFCCEEADDEAREDA
jgi:hypothetical protein